MAWSSRIQPKWISPEPSNGGMGDDLCLPIPNEPAIKLQLFRSVRCRLLGVQNRNQFAGSYVHRASPRLCELDGITGPALKLGRNCSPRPVCCAGDVHFPVAFSSCP